jgi:glycosyltransferase involved in cell wall biosynthesis
MKVAVLFDNFGPYHIARLRAAAQRTALIAVEFASRSREYAWQSLSASSEPFRLVTLLSTGTSRDVSGGTFYKILDLHLSSFRPDAVAIPGWSSRRAFAALGWCLRTRTPAIVMSESSAHDKARSSWKERLKCRYVRLCSSALVGGRTHSEYLAALGLADDRVFLGYDTVDNEYFATKAAQVRRQNSEVRKKFSLPEHFFLASARFIEKKNLPRLIDAYARYKDIAMNQAWHLVLLGDGPLRPTLCSRINAFSLQSCVHLPGFKQYDELPVYYGLTSAFVHASTVEQWGLVVNEAMASRLPVLVSNRCGCAPDLVREGMNGFTFDPFDAEAMAEAMFKVSSLSQDRLAAMGEASRRISAEWGPERFASGLAAAAECARQIGPKKASLLDRIFVRTLMLR